MKFCLIVDDSPAIRKITRAIMEDLGFTCSEAGDGCEALKICGLLSPEVIILDWNMPVLDGNGFLKALRNIKLGKYPKVFLCTTEDSPDVVEKGLAAGADEYISKPLDRDFLISKLKESGLYQEA